MDVMECGGLMLGQHGAVFGWICAFNLRFYSCEPTVYLAAAYRARSWGIAGARLPRAQRKARKYQRGGLRSHLEICRQDGLSAQRHASGSQSLVDTECGIH